MNIKNTLNKTFLVASSITLLGMLAPLTKIQATTTNFTSSTANTSKISVQSLAYDYDEVDDDIEIDFSSYITLKSTAKATVKDNSGKSYTTYIEDYDNNEIDLDVSNLAAGKTYTVKITGIKKTSASKYGTLTIKFSIPKASANLVKEVDYDEDDREVTFEFSQMVTYSNAKVVITNTSGTKTYTARIVEKENDELTVSVSGLTLGKKYKYKITGVRTSSNQTLTGTFQAIDND